MTKSIQEAAKEKIKIILDEYHVSYIDYNARDDEYTISLSKEELEQK